MPKDASPGLSRGFLRVVRGRARESIRRLGLTSTFKKAYFEARLVGERIKFLFSERPSASDAVVVAGSGRSGTTWISSLILAAPGIQQIFEPLHPRHSSDEINSLTGWNSDKQTCSYYLRSGEEDLRWYSFWMRVLSGRVRNYWTDYDRSSYLPDRFLVKLIRANLMLGYIYENFCPRIVYIVRHPCAVVNSRLKVGWKADVSDILSQEQLIEDHLKPWVRDIEQERDVLGAQAVWWALENRVAMTDLSSRPHKFVFYEALCIDQEEQIRQVFDWLGLQQLAASRWQFDRPSRMSRKGVDYSGATGHRLSAWTRELSAYEQARILSWAQRLGILWYSEGVLPVSMTETRSQ